MPLRIAFDLDGVLADMESELVRQAELIFGEAMTRRLQDGSPTDPADAKDKPASLDTEARAAAEKVTDTTPPLLKLKMTSRQQRRLWHHVETIENFWESLEELEPGIIKELAALAADRRWEIIF